MENAAQAMAEELAALKSTVSLEAWIEEDLFASAK